MKFHTPLRYPGGKGRLSSFIKSVFRHNNLLDSTYVEPYAGGSAVALAMLLDGYAWKIVINDADYLIYSFWKTILEETDWLLGRIHDTPVDMKTWLECKDIHGHYAENELREVGFATFFLNRTNRSGILKAGVIGGKNQQGNYKIDARYNKPDLMARIRRIALYRSRIVVTNRDALELLNDLPGTVSDKFFYYLDPPYYNKGSQLYRNFYNPCDHKQIAERVQSLSCSWVLTYDSVPEIHRLYKGQERLDFTLTYSAHESRKKGLEVMYYGNVAIPEKYITNDVLHFKRAS